MKLSRVLVACDLNPKYLDFWPIVRQAWNEIVGVPVTMILIADAIPDDLPFADDVILFTPLTVVHTAFQAQCIRLLYPALIEADGGVLISDMDMIPMSRSYFVDNVAKAPDDAFVSLRPIDKARREIYMCYGCTSRENWNRVFGPVDSQDDVRRILNDWAKDVDYKGPKLGTGWSKDQKLLYQHVMHSGIEVVDAKDSESGYRRLDRVSPQHWKRAELNPEQIHAFETGMFSDFHMPEYSTNKHFIWNVYKYVSKVHQSSETAAATSSE